MPRFGRSNWIGLKIPESVYIYIYCICVIYTYGWCILKREPILKHVKPGWQRNQHVVILPVQFVVRPRKACSVLGIWRGCLKECLSHPSNNHGNGKGGKGHFGVNSQFSFFFYLPLFQQGLAAVLKSDGFLSRMQLVVCGGPAWCLGSHNSGYCRSPSASGVWRATKTAFCVVVLRFCAMLRAVKACCVSQWQHVNCTLTLHALGKNVDQA